MCTCEVHGSIIPNDEFIYRSLPIKTKDKIVFIGEIEHIKCGRKIPSEYIPKEKRINFRSK